MASFNEVDQSSTDIPRSLCNPSILVRRILEQKQINTMKIDYRSKQKKEKLPT